MLNLRVDGGQVKHAAVLGHKEDKEPLEALTHAAEIVGMRIQPMRLPLADAVWRVPDDQPMVAWQPDPGRWIVLRRHSFFRVRISCPETPLESETISRRDLARRLGLQKVSEVVDLGVVTPERPAEGLRGRDEQNSASLLPAYHVKAELQERLHHGQHGHHVSPVRRFLGLMRPEMPDVVTIIIFSVITGLLYLALPLAVNALVSNLAFGTQSTPFQQALLVIAVALFAFLLLSSVMRALQYYIAEVIQRRLFVRVAADMAYRLPRVRADSLDGIHAPEMVNRFLDVVTVQKSTALLLLDGVNLVLGGVIGLIVLGFYHPFLLAFSLLLLTGIAFVVFILGRGAVRTSIQESICKYDMVNWLEELARYPRLFKGPGGYSLASERADQLARSFLGARWAHFRVLFRQIAGLLMLEVLASSSLLMVGGWLVLNMQLTLGQLVAAELIVSAIVASLSKLAKKFEAWYDALAAVDKLGHLIDLEIEAEEGDLPRLEGGGVSISARHASYAYPDGQEVFQRVSFEVPAGGRVALKGSQGSGCSTLLDLLLGLRYPTSGHISIAGFDLRSWYLEELRASVMLIRSQDIVSGTIAENIRLGRPGIGLDDVQRALRQVGLLDDVMCLPLGMHTPLVTGGLPLSSRQRTRLLLARALVLKPRLLLLDDVFDGMDRASMDELTSVILDPGLPWTVIIATRDPLVAAKCGQQIDLDDPACH
ncbi:MAG: ABC transporter ATP-binding protein/permease [Prosthecobacter sp.]|nr:ABC transporter ATP-binding protein/permease [Prosthecobacter sp.]